MDLREQLQQTLGSTHTLERELGAGGMARVFVAKETRLRRQVVVKVLSPELAAGISGERFEREIELAASLQQANIVPVLSAGDTNGLPYYTMPYVVGESLRAQLATRGTLSIAEVVSILRDVARGLSYAHERGVVHRDIKPDNILLSHGAAVVTDFGIAKAISESRTADGVATLTQAGSTIGTPAYMAPEQVAGDPQAGAPADIYALGCVAYELLTGLPPFAGMPLQRVLAAHLTETPRPVRDLRPETPPPLASLVMQCLAKQTADRPANATAVLQTLDTIVTSGAGETPVLFPRASSHRRRMTFASAAVVTVVLILASAWLRGRSALGAHVDRSIVVLPLANLGGDKADDYFGEGLSGEMTNALGKAGLRVIGPGTARTLVDRGLDTRAIANQLHVGSVLQGTVQRSRDRLRITVSLVSAVDGAVVWSEKYDRDIKDVFAVQDEIARSVASQLRVALAGGAGPTLARTETSDPEAHALYLQGLYQWNRRTRQALRQAIGLFEQAVRRDPNYARAYAAIGMADVLLPIYDDVPTDSMRHKAIDAARRALALDSTLADAHAVLGFASAIGFDNALAERAFVQALRFDSSFATAHQWHSILLTHVGRYDDALREIKRALELEPASPIIQGDQGRVLLNMHRYAEADSAEGVALAFDSTFGISLRTRALILIERGKADEAIMILETLSRQPNLRSTNTIGSLAYAYARAGRSTQARATLALLPRDTLLSAGGMAAAALSVLGDRDAAATMFRRAAEQHEPWIVIYGRSAPYDGLRKDPRLAALFAKIEAPD
jgi:serine/threonine-protein kinase